MAISWIGNPEKARADSIFPSDIRFRTIALRIVWSMGFAKKLRKEMHGKRGIQSPERIFGIE